MANVSNWIKHLQQLENDGYGELEIVGYDASGVPEDISLPSVITLSAEEQEEWELDEKIVQIGIG